MIADAFSCRMVPVDEPSQDSLSRHVGLDNNFHLQILGRFAFSTHFSCTTLIGVVEHCNSQTIAL